MALAAASGQRPTLSKGLPLGLGPFLLLLGHSARVHPNPDVGARGAGGRGWDGVEGWQGIQAVPGTGRSPRDSGRVSHATTPVGSWGKESPLYGVLSGAQVVQGQTLFSFSSLQCCARLRGLGMS